MKRFVNKWIFVGAVSLLTFGCGGSSSNSASTVVDDIDNSVDEATLEASSESAFEDSEWSDQTLATVDDTNAVTLSSGVQGAVSTVVGSAQANGVAAKNGKQAYTVDYTVNGTQGGTATIKGSYNYETTQGTTYPMTYDYDLAVTFANYKDASIAINGKVTYKATVTMTDQTNMKTTFDVNGGYSVLHQGSAYNLVTDIHVELNMVNSATTISYSYTVNGKSYSN